MRGWKRIGRWENEPREVHFSEKNDGLCGGSWGHFIYKTLSLYPSALKLMYLPLFTGLTLPRTHICMSSALTAAHLIDPVWQCISQLKCCWFNWAGQNQPMPENESIKEAIGASEAEAIRAVNQSHIPSLVSSLSARRIPIWEEQNSVRTGHWCRITGKLESINGFVQSLHQMSQNQGYPILLREGHSPAELSSHLNQIIKVSRIFKNFQAGVLELKHAGKCPFRCRIGQPWSKGMVHCRWTLWHMVE